MKMRTVVRDVIFVFMSLFVCLFVFTFIGRMHSFLWNIRATRRNALVFIAQFLCTSHQV